jgi:hypothetical protein
VVWQAFGSYDALVVGVLAGGLVVAACFWAAVLTSRTCMTCTR